MKREVRRVGSYLARCAVSPSEVLAELVSLTMPISALVLSLEESLADREYALRVLDADSRIERGELQGWRLPLVLDTTSLNEGRTLCEQLGKLRGVVMVDVVSINFEDSETK